MLYMLKQRGKFINDYTDDYQLVSRNELAEQRSNWWHGTLVACDNQFRMYCVFRLYEQC